MIRASPNFKFDNGWPRRSQPADAFSMRRFRGCFRPRCPNPALAGLSYCSFCCLCQFCDFNNFDQICDFDQFLKLLFFAFLEISIFNVFGFREEVRRKVRRASEEGVPHLAARGGDWRSSLTTRSPLIPLPEGLAVKVVVVVPTTTIMRLYIAIKNMFFFLSISV